MYTLGQNNSTKYELLNYIKWYEPTLDKQKILNKYIYIIIKNT